MKKNVFIKKASGELEPFDEEKIKNACLRAGASEEIAESIVEKLKERLRPKMTTKEIFWIVYRLLEREKPHVASKFNLKRAILSLGPAGFTFETFFSEILEANGYKVNLRQVIPGKCIQHEVDIIAHKEKDREMVECKYHNKAGVRCDAKTTLYIWARFLDLNEGHLMGKCPKFDRAWVVTNTKFTDDAIAYAECQGMKLVGWNYPIIGNLRDMIERKKLYPVTILRSVDSYILNKLSKVNLTLVKDLVPFSSDELVKKINISVRRADTLMQEVASIMKNN